MFLVVLVDFWKRGYHSWSSLELLLQCAWSSICEKYLKKNWDWGETNSFREDFSPNIVPVCLVVYLQRVEKLQILLFCDSFLPERKL